MTMKFSHIALACSLAIGGSAALAQNEAAVARDSQPQQSASEFGHKITDGAKHAGQSTKKAFNKMTGKAHDAKEEAKADTHDKDTHAMGAGKDSNKDKHAKDQAMGKDHDKAMHDKDTRAMGAGKAPDKDRMAATPADSGSREQRMDDAYANYKSQAK
jgi:hypothetical protein